MKKKMRLVIFAFVAVLVATLVQTELSVKKSTIPLRVANGAMLLDTQYPEGWAYRINVDRLSVYSLKKCILGQLEGDFHEGKRKLGLGAGLTSSSHGFATLVPWRYQWLTKEWKRQIAKRMQTQ